MLNLLRKEIRARRGAMIGWGLGLALYGCLIVLLFPAMSATLAEMELPDFYAAFGDMSNIGSLEGWLPLEFYDLIPVLLGILAIVAGTSTLAGEEDSGTLELLLALPIARWQLVLVKALALAIVMLVILLLVFLGVLIGYLSIQSQIQTDVTVVELFWASLNGWPILMLLTMLSLFLGAYLPRRRHAAVVATVFLVVSYLVHTIGAVSETIEPLQPYFPLQYYASAGALRSQVEASNILLLLGSAALCLLLAVVSFQRRNVTVGAWPWRRARRLVTSLPEL